jgi:hypothetical protein
MTERETLERLVAASDAARARSWVDVGTVREFVAALDAAREVLAVEPEDEARPQGFRLSTRT